MATIEVLFFDVLGTVVDWRGSIADKVAVFLKRHHLLHIDSHSFADAWVGTYDAAIEPIRSGQRAFASLDIINMENPKACLIRLDLTPSRFASSELEALNLAWHRLRPWPDAAEGSSQLRKHYIVAPYLTGIPGCWSTWQNTRTYRGTWCSAQTVPNPISPRLAPISMLASC